MEAPPLLSALASLLPAARGCLITVEAPASTEDFGAAQQLLHASTVVDWVTVLLLWLLGRVGGRERLSVTRLVVVRGI